MGDDSPVRSPIGVTPCRDWRPVGLCLCAPNRRFPHAVRDLLACNTEQLQSTASTGRTSSFGWRLKICCDDDAPHGLRVTPDSLSDLVHRHACVRELQDVFYLERLDVGSLHHARLHQPGGYRPAADQPLEHPSAPVSLAMCAAPLRSAPEPEPPRGLNFSQIPPLSSPSEVSMITLRRFVQSCSRTSRNARLVASRRDLDPPPVALG